MKLLLIEDDTVLAENTKLYLERLKYKVEVAHNGSIGLLKAQKHTYSVILLDWMIPYKDGITVLKELREGGNTTPVIMTTAKGQLEQKLDGFSAGADDYLSKPYTLAELAARIEAVIRRAHTSQNTSVLKIRDLNVNIHTTNVTLGKNELLLTPTEYSILEYLCVNKGKTVSRAELLHHVWNDDVNQFTNHVDVHVKNLRKKLAQYSEEPYILTVKNRGYLINE